MTIRCGRANALVDAEQAQETVQAHEGAVFVTQLEVPPA